MTTLLELRDALARGATSARGLLETCLERATDPEGEGARVFVALDAAAARAQADAMDALRAAGAEPSPWAGIPISVKDLFDVRGQVTRAGSKVRADAPAAADDCPVVARLRRAGFVLVGRTNMTEFAYSGVGINPHYGTPRNPYDRLTGRIPGGSSSGAAISVTDRMAAAGIGTDTGGSCRIPAALTGIVGFKPTARRVPTGGVFPLSATLDSVGPLTRSASCASILDDVLAGGPGRAPYELAPRGLRIAVLDNYVTDDLEAAVSQAYERALESLERVGVVLDRVRFESLERLPALNAKGGIAAAEAYAVHRAALAVRAPDYDPRVGTRIARGAEQTAADYVELLGERAGLIGEFERWMRGYDAVAAPTVPIVAPAFSAFSTDAEYVRLNLLLLRNPSAFNFLDGCAISLPMHAPDEPPTGFMLAAPGGADARLLAVARALETHLRHYP